MSDTVAVIPAKTTADNVLGMTRYCGPALLEGGDRTRVQITQGRDHVQLSKAQAWELGMALLKFSADQLKD